MSKKLFSRLVGLFSSRTFIGTDRHGNRYFTRNEEVDGILKEKRWVIFKGEEDPTALPVEWICWLSGQRKKAPTPEEMIELEAKRERVKLNVALLKKEEEERKAKDSARRQSVKTVGGPDLKSFMQQFPGVSFDNRGKEPEEVSDATDGISDDRFRKSETAEEGSSISPDGEQQPMSTEPTGSGQSFKPGTWQPPM
ncbi:uncharacterized protein LOC131240285 [Magnolia sinica]|uniref:uncharacterized protein LOC131240285 n=1 Tax=Magnolia sinica TaxID=86752 RepID=UPI00265B54AC|nr:uncharacterized protein LOC131240285 [Magnolia sinica]